MKSQNLEAVQILLSKNTSISAANPQGWNSLMIALQMNNLEILKVMIEGSVNEKERWKYGIKNWVEDAWIAMDGVSKEGLNILHICSMHSEEKIIKYVLEMLKEREIVYNSSDCAPVFQKLQISSLSQMVESTSRKKNTPFLLAVKYNRLDAIKLLVETKCNIYARNGKLQNAMHIAISHGYLRILEYLILIDADRNILRSQFDIQQRRPKELDISNKFENSFLHIWDYARLGNFVKLEELIEKKICSVNETTFLFKLTPLHIAVEYRQLHVIRLLISLGADPSMKNTESLTPYDIARSLMDPDYEAKVFSLLKGGQYIVEQDYSQRKLAGVYMKLMKNHSVHEFSLNKLPKVKPRIVIVESTEETEAVWDLIRKRLIEKEVSIMKMYEMMDKNNDGALSLEEFYSLTVWLGVPISREMAMTIFRMADENQNGVLEYSEILKKMHLSAVNSKKMNRMAGSVPKLLLNKTFS